MVNRRTFCTSLDGPINALAVNRDANQVAVAGRNVFKILEINDEQNIFQESINLRVGKNLNLNYSCNDVVWNFIDTNLLATAATNGAIVIWNLMKSSRSKVDQVISYHKRTVNKVCFHPTEGNYLLSGSQDGTMKLFDLRKKDTSIDFNSQSESVRDVQFSPCCETMFAAVQENGNVQLWDYRKNDRYLKQFTAHSGPVFSCDWHPDDKLILATAGRDKTIKIWDANNETPTVKYCIQTIASVAKLKWRPQRKCNIASCSLVVDFSVYVWDYNRPFVPFAAFMEHRDVATGFSWRNDAKTVISCGKDGLLIQHVIKDAYRPASHANPAGLALNRNGDIVHASSDFSVGKYRTQATQQQKQQQQLHQTQSTSTLSISQMINKNSNISQNVSNTSSSLGQYANNTLRYFKRKPDSVDLFRCCSSTLFYSTETNPSITTMDWFFISAIRYQLTGKPIKELCSQNADVATILNRPHVAQIWRIIGQLFSNYGRAGTFSGQSSVLPSTNIIGPNSTIVSDEKLTEANELRIPSRHTSGANPLFKSTYPTPLQELTSAQTEEDSDSSFLNDANYLTNSNGKGHFSGGATSAEGNKMYRSQQPLSPQAAVNDYFFGDGDISSTTLNTNFDIVPNSSKMIDNNYDVTQDYELQREAFQPRHPIQEVQSPLDIDDGSSPTSLDEEEIFDDSNILNNNMKNLSVNEDNFSNSTLSITATINPSWKFLDLIKDLLYYYVKQGDVQMAISIVTVLGDRIKHLIDEDLLEIWFLSYIDLLSRFQLWNVINQIILLSPLRNINILNQTSTTIYTSCNKCLKGLSSKASWLCDRCKTSPTKCIVCHETTKGLYAWCQGCSHGGHLKHMKEWFQLNRQCPTGCGHQCEFT